MKFALVGNPNCGKTTLFNNLTGSTAKVGNWPGVTVDRKEGIYKGLSFPLDVIDLPGIYSLAPYSPEEAVACSYIIDEKPDLIINIIDATNLERNLYLTTQLLEIDIPILVVLNMTDLLKSKGMKIDFRQLEKELGVPVSEISAISKNGIKEMMLKGVSAAKHQRTGCSVISYSALGKDYDSIVALLRDNDTDNACFYTTRILENPEDYTALYNLSNIAEIKKNAEQTADGDFEEYIADQRYRYITDNYMKSISVDLKKASQSEKIDNILTHRLLGIPIFLVIMFVVFHLTFSENLFFVTGLPSPGVFLSGIIEAFVERITVIMSFFLISVGANADSMLHGIIIDGLFAGVGTVLSFLPLIVILFLFLSIMEDSGYMSRAAFLMDRLFRYFGVSGKAFLPLLMGFGCSVPAISATKTLESDEEKKITIMMMTGFSCGAKLPIWTVFTAALFPSNADIVVFCIYIGGIAVMCIAGIVLKKFFIKGAPTSFIMELPPYHMPRPSNVAKYLWDKCSDYIYRATTIISISTIIIWLLSNYSFSLKPVEANSIDSMLGIIGNFLRPLFIPLGFASDPQSGWKPIVAILTGLIAKEMVVATTGVLYSPGIGSVFEDEGSRTALISILPMYFTPLAGLSFMFFNLLSIPCMAAVAAAKAELKSTKSMFMVLGFWLLIAYITSFLIYTVGSIFLI